MAPPRAFDYDLLQELVISHPTWTTRQFVAELTAANRRKDPRARPVNTATVDSVLSRYRSAWEEESDVTIPSRLLVYEEIAPPRGALNTDHKKDTFMRYLREVAKDAQGDEPELPSEVQLRQAALGWAQRMRQDREVVDLTSDGIPITRPARAEEINSKGELISLAAWKVPGWRQPAGV